MSVKETISPLRIVPAQTAPVRSLLSDEEKQFLNLLAKIFVTHLLKMQKDVSEKLDTANN